MLSSAERSAMCLDGELVALGDTAMHVDRVVSAHDRLRALAVELRSAHIVSGRAAAWVHGAARLPSIVDVAVLRHRRADEPSGCRLHIRRVRLDDCITAGDRRATGRLRTAVDLLADDPFDDEAVHAIRLLVDDWHALDRAIPRSGRAAPSRMRARLHSMRADGGAPRR